MNETSSTVTSVEIRIVVFGDAVLLIVAPETNAKAFVEASSLTKMSRM